MDRQRQQILQQINKIMVKKNPVEMHSTHNDGKSAIAERFIGTLKKNVYKYVTSILKNVYIHKLNDIDYKYKNPCHRTIKMKPADVKPSTYVDASKEINIEDPKFKIGDIVGISKDKNIFAQGYVPNWSEEGFVIKNTVLWIYVISDLKV